MNEKISLPKEVCGIIEALETKGYEAYAVGGAVRDLLLGITPGDFDITTSALPMEVKEVFPRTIDTGIAHGTVTVMKYGVGYEVTTYRIDGKYNDARHPEAVEFTRSLREDLRRRDFTVNAMAYNDRTGLVDLFGGREDLERGVIRAVGIPEERFREDALRIMRCVRFAAQLNFTIEENTLSAAAALSENLCMISRERIREEFLKILLSDHPDMLMTLYRIGGFREWYEPYRDGAMAAYSAGENDEMYAARLERTIRVLRKLPKDRILRLAGFLADAADTSETDPGPAQNVRAAFADQVLTELKFDNETRDAVVELVSYRELPMSLSKSEVRKLIAKIGYIQFDRLMQLLEAEYLVDGSPLDALQVFKGYRQEIEAAGDCVRLKDMQLGGKDLIRMGMKPGVAMGTLLEQLFSEVLAQPELNTEEALRMRAQELMRGRAEWKQ